MGDAALAERSGITAEQQGFGWLCGRIDENSSEFGKDLRQLLAQFLTQLVIQIGQRLIEKDQARCLTMARGQCGTLLLPAGQVKRRALQIRGELQEIGGLLDLAVDGRFVSLAQSERRGNVFVDAERGIIDELLVTMATERSCTRTPVTSLPSNTMEPDVGLSSPAIRRIRDVLPDRVGPSRTLSDRAAGSGRRDGCEQSPLPPSTGFAIPALFVSLLRPPTTVTDAPHGPSHSLIGTDTNLQLLRSKPRTGICSIAFGRSGRPRFLDIIFQCPRLLRTQIQALLGAAPENVLGASRHSRAISQSTSA